MVHVHVYITLFLRCCTILYKTAFTERCISLRCTQWYMLYPRRVHLSKLATSHARNMYVYYAHHINKTGGVFNTKEQQTYAVPGYFNLDCMFSFFVSCIVCILPQRRKGVHDYICVYLPGGVQRISCVYVVQNVHDYYSQKKMTIPSIRSFCVLSLY